MQNDLKLSMHPKMSCLLRKRQVNGYCKNEKHLESKCLCICVFVSTYRDNCRIQLATNIDEIPAISIDFGYLWIISSKNIEHF